MWAFYQKQLQIESYSLLLLLQPKTLGIGSFLLHFLFTDILLHRVFFFNKNRDAGVGFYKATKWTEILVPQLSLNLG